jgi:Holliday junction resolvase RusA-like endonuclease
MLCAFAVYGKPVPQGSVVAHVRGGRASIHYASGSGLAVWRNQVTSAAQDAWGLDNVYGGPMGVALIFRMKRPRNHYRDLQGTVRPAMRDARPDVMPDLDKLVRAVLDALTGVVWRDDGQVCDIMASKVYADSPGVDIVIT